MNDNKPLELRDQLALSILSGLLSSDNPNLEMNIIIGKFNSKVSDRKEMADIKTRELIELAYYLADQMRKVRLSSFE